MMGQSVAGTIEDIFAPSFNLGPSIFLPVRDNSLNTILSNATFYRKGKERRGGNTK